MVCEFESQAEDNLHVCCSHFPHYSPHVCRFRLDKVYFNLENRPEVRMQTSMASIIFS